MCLWMFFMALHFEIRNSCFFVFKYKFSLSYAYFCKNECVKLIVLFFEESR
jgi:hypothetical protein